MEDWAIVAVVAMLIPIAGMYYKNRGAQSGTNGWDEFMNDMNPDEFNKKLRAENSDLKGRVEKLEERVKVLERIATDRGNRLTDEIESLERAS